MTTLASEGHVAMTQFTCWFRNLPQLAYTLLTFLADGVRFLGLCLRPSPTLAAENLFLRKQLALYQERQVKPRRTTPAMRLALV
jgi:putative transposase